jgi:kanamycin kinase
VLAGPPSDSELFVPAKVHALIAGRAYVPVWRNELGGLTFEVQARSGREFIKWAPAGSGLDLSREAGRLRWASSFLAVPRVLDHGSDDNGTWLVTAGVPGDNAVSARWRAEPKTAVTAIGEGLRVLHDTLPVNDCPYSWSTEARIADAHQRAAQGGLDPADWHPDHRSLEIPAALRIADRPPEVDQLVVCHGDACAPNTLIGEDGRWTGHVDLGSLGVADRWADLAIATWSTQWNYGPGWEGRLLDAYGIDPDPPRITYYRLLWDLGP